MDSKIKSCQIVQNLSSNVNSNGCSAIEQSTNLILEMSKVAELLSNQLYQMHITSQKCENSENSASTSASSLENTSLDISSLSQMNLSVCSQHDKPSASLVSQSFTSLSSLIFSSNENTEIEEPLEKVPPEVEIKKTPCTNKETPSIPRIKDKRNGIYKNRKQRIFSPLKFAFRRNFKNLSPNF